MIPTSMFQLHSRTTLMQFTKEQLVDRVIELQDTLKKPAIQRVRQQLPKKPSGDPTEQGASLFPDPTEETLTILNGLLPRSDAASNRPHPLVHYQTHRIDLGFLAGDGLVTIGGTQVSVRKLAAAMDGIGIQVEQEAFQDLRQAIVSTLGGRLTRTLRNVSIRDRLSNDY